MTDTESKEVSLHIASELLTNEKLHDVTLKGSDGVEVTAVRSVLATRSSVFMAMLFGDFSESSKDTIDIEYSGNVLQAVVEYIHTEKPQMLNWKKRKAPDNEKEDNENEEENSTFELEEIRTLVELAAAAKYFGLPGLTAKIKDFFSIKNEGFSSICFALLEFCKQKGPAVPDELAAFAWLHVRNAVADCNRVENRNLLACLSQETLEEILTNKQTEKTEFQLFKVLQAWVEGGPSDRMAIGQKMIHFIKLEKISAQHLAVCVEPSRLATPEHICNAYKDRAMAHEFCGLAIEESRFQPLLWSKTMSMLFTGHDATSSKRDFDMLRCTPMTSGTYEWKLERVRSGPKVLFFGVAQKTVQLNNENFIGKQKGTWGFDTRGGIYSGDGECFGRGEVEAQETVTVKLNLLPGKNGTLSASYQDEDGNSVTRQVLLQNCWGCCGGFLPIVSSFENYGFRLLDFQKLAE